MQSVLLNGFYDLGNLVGPILSFVFSVLLAIMIVYVMVVYLFPKEK